MNYFEIHIFTAMSFNTSRTFQLSYFSRNTKYSFHVSNSFQKIYKIIIMYLFGSKAEWYGLLAYQGLFIAQCKHSVPSHRQISCVFFRWLAFELHMQFDSPSDKAFEAAWSLPFLTDSINVRLASAFILFPRLFSFRV